MEMQFGQLTPGIAGTNEKAEKTLIHDIPAPLIETLPDCVLPHDVFRTIGVHPVAQSAELPVMAVAEPQLDLRTPQQVSVSPYNEGVWA